MYEPWSSAGGQGSRPATLPPICDASLGNPSPQPAVPSLVISVICIIYNGVQTIRCNSRFFRQAQAFIDSLKFTSTSVPYIFKGPMAGVWNIQPHLLTLPPPRKSFYIQHHHPAYHWNTYNVTFYTRDAWVALWPNPKSLSLHDLVWNVWNKKRMQKYALGLIL